MKCLALHSGGLDSTLAICVLKAQGIDVEAVHFVSVFDPAPTDSDVRSKAEKSCAALNVKAHTPDFSEDLLALVKNPPHGRGSRMNPCIDCHATMVRRAAAMMKELGAAFLCTGEVLGERPMSQRREALGIVERDAGVEGLLLRPLSAKLLDPTIPEKQGWVDREKLHAICGRCRKPQFALAKEFGITKYPSPAGGCLLTDPGFAARLRDLLSADPSCTVDDARLLKFGRHFRLNPGVRVVVGRNEQENAQLEKLARPGDLLMDAIGVTGPLTLVRGAPNAEQLKIAAAITLRYGKAMSLPAAQVRVQPPTKSETPLVVDAAPADEALLSTYRVAAPDEGQGGRRVRD